MMGGEAVLAPTACRAYCTLPGHTVRCPGAGESNSTLPRDTGVTYTVRLFVHKV